MMPGPAPSHTSSNRAWVLLGAAWSAAFVGLGSWLAFTPAGALVGQLAVLQRWSLDAGVFALVVCGVLVAREFAPALSRLDGYLLTAVAALSLLLTLGVAPRTNRIFYDEQIYQGIGQNMADLGLAQVCNDGNLQSGRLHCDAGEYNKQPYAYPHLLSLGYRLFGTRVGSAFALNAIAAAVSVCGLYLLVFTLSGRRDAAFVAALLLAITPEQVMWSATAAVEPTASMACILALLAAALYRRSGSVASLAGVAVTLAWAVQFRPESVLVSAVVLLLVWPRLNPDLAHVRTWWVGLLFLALVAVHAGHLMAVRHIPWGTAGARFSLSYLPGNLAVNGWFYLSDERFPFVFTLLALCGLALWWRTVFAWALALCFLLFWGIDLVFYAGSFNYGADVRYALLTFPPIAALAGLGVSRLLEIGATRWPQVPLRSVATLAVVFVFMQCAPVMRAVPEEAWAARADERFAREVAASLPPDAYVLTHNPGMFQLWGRSAGQMSRVLGNGPVLAYLGNRYPGGVYLHWNFWCNVDDPVQQDICRRALAMGEPASVFGERQVRDQRLAFYRIQTKSP